MSILISSVISVVVALHEISMVFCIFILKGMSTSTDANMTSCKKRKGSNGVEGICGTAMSSYAQLNLKYKMSKEQCQQLLNELEETKQKGRTAFLESQLQQTKSERVLELLLKQLVDDKIKSEAIIQVLKDVNGKLTKRVGLFHQRMEKLQCTIAASSDAYDAMVAKI